MEETKPTKNEPTERYSEDAKTTEETTKTKTKQRKIIRYTTFGLIIFSCSIAGLYLLSDPVNLHDSKTVHFILETNDNLSTDLKEWSQLTPEPVSWKSLELKSKEIHNTVIHYLLRIDDINTSSTKEYTIQQEYKSYLMDVAEQMSYSEKVYLAHTSQKYNDESFYLDEVLVYMRRAHDHLNTVGSYLERENIHLNQE
jgi:hypothetical protein